MTTKDKASAPDLGTKIVAGTVLVPLLVTAIAPLHYQPFLLPHHPEHIADGNSSLSSSSAPVPYIAASLTSSVASVPSTDFVWYPGSTRKST